ncbi:MAG: ribosome maturation factor RimM [Wenzhouxiangellaceae bacterium]|nr:ribosome maturation factor RimM [Wenzhouxiangellaceae bacterium]
MSGSGSRIELGRINGAWGAAGWVKLFSLTDPPENIFDYQPWRIDSSPGLLVVHEWRRQGPKLVARLDRVETPDEAEALRGAVLFIDRADLPPPGPERYYWHDLIGMEVYNRAGVRLGRVVGLLDAGVHDVLRVAAEQRSAPGFDSGPGSASDRVPRELLIPFVPDHYVFGVDRGAGRIDVDWEPEWSRED